MNQAINLASDRAAEAERVYYETWKVWKLHSGDDIMQVTTVGEQIQWLHEAGRIYKLYAELILNSERPLLASLTHSIDVVTPHKEPSLLVDSSILMYMRVRGLKHQYNTSIRISFFPPTSECFIQDQIKRFLKTTEWGLAGFIRRGETPVAEG